MLGLREVANRNITKKEEEDNRINARRNIDRMFINFINENLDEIHEFFPTTKLYGTSFKATQRDSLRFSDWDNYSIEFTKDNKIVIRRMIK